MTKALQVSARNGRVIKGISMKSKIVLITGANTGIGYETVKDLAQRGARVIMACRDMKKCEDAKQKILQSNSEAELSMVELDLASLESVRQCAKKILETESKLDVLINNAGIMLCPQWKTQDNFEMQLGVNHIGHFLLTNLLLDLIKKSDRGRIVVVSSSAHYSGKMNWDDLMNEKDYHSFRVYQQSKLANVLFSRELSKRLLGTGITVNSLHPGLVFTELGRHMFNTSSFWDRLRYTIVYPFVKLVFKTPLQGAQTSIYCAVAPELEEVTGKFFADCKVKEESAAAQSDEDAKRLWDISLNLTGLQIS